MFYQIENTNRDMKIIFKEPKKFLSWKVKWPIKQTHKRGSTNRFELVEKIIGTFRYKSIEIMEFECKEEKKNNKWADLQRNLQYH